MPVGIDDVRAPFVKFESRPKVNQAASDQAGRYVAQDVDYIIIVPHGSEGKTELCEEYTQWLAKHKPVAGNKYYAPGAGNDTPAIMDSRFPRDWLDRIEAGYAAWKKGEELPLDGTPLKLWPAIISSPAMLQNCIASNILTVEHLAGASDEAINSIGMGGRALRETAIRWLKLANEKERNHAAQAITKLTTDVAQLTAQVTELLAENRRLQVASNTKAA